MNINTESVYLGRKIYFICVSVKDIDNILKTVPKRKSKLLKLRHLDNKINISVDTTKYKHDEVLEIMQNYFNEYKEKQKDN